MCALTSSRLDDFSDIVTYMRTVMTTIFLGGEGESFYPSNTLDLTPHNYRFSTVILLHTSGGRRGVNSSNSVDTRVFVTF